MKFEVSNFNAFEVMPRTWFSDARTDRRKDEQCDSRVPPPNFVCGAITNFPNIYKGFFYKKNGFLAYTM